MEVNITILVENTTPAAPLVGEYGFSALLTVDDRKILFDTGSSDAIFKNSNYLGAGLDKVDAIVISHGHFDHTGAVVPFLEKYGKKQVYAHSNVFAKRFASAGNNQYRDIGCVFSKEEMVDAGAEINFTDNFYEIFPGVYATGEIPRITDYEDVGGKFVVEVNGSLQEDKIPDDMALVINHPDGLIIISGCAHSGIINTIKYAVEKTGRSEILAFVGGTHLIRASEERLQKTITALELYDVQKCIVSHCTGFYAAAKLYNALGNRVIKGETGMSFMF